MECILKISNAEAKLKIRLTSLTLKQKTCSQYKRSNYLKEKLESKNYECDYGVFRRPLRRPPAEPAQERCPLDMK